jgi:hypothetical protein
VADQIPRPAISDACLHGSHIPLEMRRCKDPACSCMCHPSGASQIPAEAITAAAKAIHSLTCGECDYHPDDLTVVSARDREDAAQVLKAAVPHLICCEYDGCDCQKAGRDAERERIRQVAIEHHATYPGPVGHHPLADLLGGES